MAQSAVDKALNKFSTPACPTMTGNVLIPKFVVICYLVISPQVLPCNEINFVILPYKMACRVARGLQNGQDFLLGRRQYSGRQKVQKDNSCLCALPSPRLLLAPSPTLCDLCIPKRFFPTG